MIAAWIRLAIIEAMSQPEDRDQRLWFVVDELDALGAIDGLKDALARLRKFGGRCVLGFQSIAQVSNTYGQGDAHTIIENCANTLILRCSGSENGGTSHFASKLIGEREMYAAKLRAGAIAKGFSRRAACAARPTSANRRSPKSRCCLRSWSGCRICAATSRRPPRPRGSRCRWPAPARGHADMNIRSPVVCDRECERRVVQSAAHGRTSSPLLYRRITKCWRIGLGALREGVPVLRRRPI
jgi:hypothetical protein